MTIQKAVRVPSPLFIGKKNVYYQIVTMTCGEFFCPSIIRHLTAALPQLTTRTSVELQQ